MLTLIKNANIYAPEHLGKKDILIGNNQILAIEDSIVPHETFSTVWDAKGKTVTPGFIDQHVHIIGAGGKHGYASMTPEIMLGEFISCGTTTVVGLLGTDGTARSVKTLYAKARALTDEGISAYMFTSYFSIDPVTITGSIQDDMVFIDKVLGCKVAISDERSSYPTATELLRHLREVRVGGQISGKKGILHIHLGKMTSQIDVLLELVEKYEYPIENISPTHVGRTKALFDQSLRFAELGGMIDITTGGTKYTDPYKSVLYALEKGISMDQLTFSSDGNAGLGKTDANGKLIGFTKAPIHLNMEQTAALIRKGGLPISEAIRLVTTNPAKNLALKQKGHLKVGYDADICCFDKDFNLTDVFAMGKQMMRDKEVLVKGNFEV
ncbi:beta-aspartyl-peptidase [Sinomicrobium pectinilyticum]|uniref:Isoaspartyl dipeptidase n=1 Tax=Sinomicrobium pectinilyticum TaxID=1084421 RepID=A0A3N0E2N0_SINP1|nr:beta-aspartyl-peptidase [Sinomicrobium pectinilyticum]RNL82076.1 beta-aspartyl-peptidase [Sinomicrobium pectinilyticum]